MPNVAPNLSVGRFRNDLAHLIGEAALAAGRFGIAVSGGPDSMALLSLAHRAFPGRVEAATVDHRLRPEAADEAAMVARECARLGIAHATLVVPRPIGGNISASAREVRYALLHEWRAARGLDWLLTAHHADDQLETLIMRLNRASGVGGLAGVRGRNGTVLRPLLGWRRADLAAVIDGQGLPRAHDPSNDDPHYDRARLRAHLRATDWIDPVAAGRSAAACADAEEALQWLVEELADAWLHSPRPGLWVLERWAFPREVQRRLLAHMLRLADPDAAPRGEGIDRVLARLRQGGKATLGRGLFTAGRVWRLRLAPPRRSERRGSGDKPA